jgi:multidrug transporter EmrE-like cation transporter
MVAATVGMSVRRVSPTSTLPSGHQSLLYATSFCFLFSDVRRLTLLAYAVWGVGVERYLSL